MRCWGSETPNRRRYRDAAPDGATPACGQELGPWNRQIPAKVGQNLLYVQPHQRFHEPAVVILTLCFPDEQVGLTSLTATVQRVLQACLGVMPNLPRRRGINQTKWRVNQLRTGAVYKNVQRFDFTSVPHHAFGGWGSAVWSACIPLQICLMG